MGRYYHSLSPPPPPLFPVLTLSSLSLLSLSLKCSNPQLPINYEDLLSSQSQWSVRKRTIETTTFFSHNPQIFPHLFSHKPHLLVAHDINIFYKYWSQNNLKNSNKNCIQMASDLLWFMIFQLYNGAKLIYIQQNCTSNFEF